MLRRSLFFVPGAEPRKLEKARSCGADTLLLDLEDSVAPAEKERARELVAALLRDGGFGASEPAVRVNPPGTPYFDDDLAAVVEAGARAVMLPKAETAAGLSRVAKRLDELEGPEREGSGREPLRLLALVETALGIAQVVSLTDATPRVAALCFGHADFSRDMGVPASDPAEGVLYHARCSLAIAARAGRVAPIDTICLDVRDDEAFRRAALEGLRLGYEGKLCIHPRQVTLANEIYTPSASDVEYAQRVVEASEKAQSEGRGVFTVDGKMVDAPLVAMQQRVLEQARQAGMLAAPTPEESTRG